MQAELDSEIKKLLNLKAEFKTLTGSDWTPSAVQPAVSMPATTGADTSQGAQQLTDKIEAQGNKVRELKAAKADKVILIKLL